jgi:hypothetical protein
MQSPTSPGPRQGCQLRDHACHAYPVARAECESHR